MQIDELLDKVTDWNRRPLFLTVLRALLQPMADLDEFCAQLPKVFDVDFSVGVQEDIDGLWIGRDRLIPYQRAIGYFSFNNPALGFDMSSPWYQSGLPRRANYTIKLDDETFRRLLYAKIAANEWNGQTDTAVAALGEFFKDDFVFIADGSDRTITFALAGRTLQHEELTIFSQDYIPLRPAGVKQKFLISSAPRPIFGFNSSSDYVAGFNVGAWGVTPDYIISRDFLPTHRMSFNLTGSGQSLDLPGGFIGVSRYVPVDTRQNYFCFDDAARGFDGPSWHKDGDPEILTAPVRLDDERYARLLAAAQKLATWDGSAHGLAIIFETYFTDCSVYGEDDGDTITLTLVGPAQAPIDMAVFSHSKLPIQTTKTLKFVVASEANKFVFGFDQSNGRVGGFNTSAWATTPETMEVRG